MQTSVSQRPLTARKRQLQNPQRQVNGLHQSGSVSDRPENLLQPNSMTAAGISYGSAGRMSASSIPVFRTAANRSQMTQQNSQEGNHHGEARFSHINQSINSPITHGGLSAQPQSQQRDRIIPDKTNIATVQRGVSPVTQHRNALQPRSSARDGLSNDRQSTSYEREGSSSVARDLRSSEHQAYDQNQGAQKCLLSQHGSKAAPWLPDQQFAAAGQMNNSSRADSGGAGQAAAATGIKPMMYVKPPWAIDDPYQVQ